ncbi:MAG: hypothetical protein M3P11_04655 [Actinomycetota bacterium]|nr:hypothetical protein [Actinomycetota bacterium]
MDDETKEPLEPPMPPPPPDIVDTGKPGYGGLRMGAQPPQVVAGGPTSPSPAGLLVLGGGLAVVIGVFLPWLQASGPGGTFSENGLKIGTFGTLILGGFAVAKGLSVLRPGLITMRLSSPLLTGALLAGLMALRWNFLQTEISDTRALSPSVTAGLGVGVWLVIAGTAAILLGGLLGMSRRG